MTPLLPSNLPRSLHHSFADGAAGWTAQNENTKLVEWLGRPALALGSGHILAPVALEPPYTLAATVSGGPGDSYVGFCFHRADADNCEMVYLAPHSGARPTAIQYDPVINGSNTWQIFGDADGLASAPLYPPLRPAHWYQLRFDVWEEIAQVFVDDDRAPKATFVLRTELRRGRVGLWAYLPSYAADFEVKPLSANPPPLPQAKVEVPAGTVRDWLVAEDLAGSESLGPSRPSSSEHNGTLCLNRLYRTAPDRRAIAACEIDVPAGARAVVLECGYSDQARIWWDQQLIAEGEWKWDPPTGADGRIRPGQRRIPLSTGPGRHLLLFDVGVSEPFFGWGLTARVTADEKPCSWQRASRSAFADRPGEPTAFRSDSH